MKKVVWLACATLIAALSGCGGGDSGSKGAGGVTTSDAGSGAGSAPVSTGPAPANPVSGPAPTNPAPTNPAPTGPAPANPVDTTGTGTGTVSMQQEMVAAINQARSEGRSCGSVYYNGTTPVAWNDRIAAAAVRHSSDMAANDFFSHTGSDGTSPGDRLTQAGYTWTAYGENIAVGYQTAAEAVRAWLASEGHCKNIMNPTYAEIGAGAADGTYNGISPMRYWTLDLGKR